MTTKTPSTSSRPNANKQHAVTKVRHEQLATRRLGTIAAGTNNSVYAPLMWNPR